VHIEAVPAQRGTCEFEYASPRNPHASSLFSRAGFRYGFVVGFGDRGEAAVSARGWLGKVGRITRLREYPTKDRTSTAERK
jgi:hypothetical protein